MTKAKPPVFGKKIKTSGVHRTSTGAPDGFRYDIDPSEQQVIDNRTGPRLNPPRRKQKSGADQTSWLK